ncbi:MAG: 30S ribosomal protein S3 [Candidatus Moranbacteria bacterium]|nr:30S ribosomal protein S3 [Candidatus Moranbacteria bacterium]NTW46164.1 30S ribosomal protein S3 [Candidatus Moranbacteria bacterium]
MGQKIHPVGFRLGVTAGWKSRWFDSRNFQKTLRQDVEIREFIKRKWKAAAIADVFIERSANVIRVIIETSRPGVLIGRGGTGIEDLTRVMKGRFFRGRRTELKVDVREIKTPDENASLVAQSVAEQLEKRMPFRRVLKGTIENVMKQREVKGAKIEISGRLGGAEMSRREWTAKGEIPLHTLRADIDFAQAEARTTYGTIGVKVWINRGEKFDTRGHEAAETETRR